MARWPWSVALLTLVLSGAPDGRAQTVRPIEAAAEDLLRACVSLPGPPAARPGDPGVAAPPGLARGASVTVTLVPTDRGRLYAYRDHGGRQIVCGLAVYEVDPKPIAERLAAVVASSPLKLTLDPVGHYALSSAAAGRVRYFANARAPGLQGVLIFERPIGPDAPSLEADFHVTLLN